MTKLRLDYDALEVESFDTEEIPREQGTVHGHASGMTCPFRDSCNGLDTCYDGCPGSSLLTWPEHTCPHEPSYPDICMSDPVFCG